MIDLEHVGKLVRHLNICRERLKLPFGSCPPQDLTTLRGDSARSCSFCSSTSKVEVLAGTVVLAVEAV